MTSGYLNETSRGGVVRLGSRTTRSLPREVRWEIKVNKCASHIVRHTITNTFLPEWKGIRHHILGMLKDEGVRMEKEQNQPRKAKRASV